MKYVELIIKLDTETYKAACNLGVSYFVTGMRSDKTLLSKLAFAIRKGTPLPKGHGRLIDADIILNKALTHRESYMETENSSYCRGKLHAYESYVEEVENAPTIIEADKGDTE